MSSKRPTGKMARLDGPVRLIVDYEGREDFLSDYAATLSTGSIVVEMARAPALEATVELVVSFPGLLVPIALAGSVAAFEESGIRVQLLPASREQLAGLADRIARGDRRLVAPVVRLLLVEDNLHICELISDGLRAAGARHFGREIAFSVAAAHDGAEALAMIDGGGFDAVIVDAYLPVVGGAKLIEHARARLGTQVPIIGVSGGGDGARDAVMAAGANAFLDKPVRLRPLVEQLRAFLGIPAPAALT